MLLISILNRLILESEMERRLRLHHEHNNKHAHHHRRRPQKKHHHHHRKHKKLNHITLNNHHDPHRHLSKRERKLLFTFSWDANEKRFTQRQIMQQLIRKGNIFTFIFRQYIIHTYEGGFSLKIIDRDTSSTFPLISNEFVLFLYLIFWHLYIFENNFSLAQSHDKNHPNKLNLLETRSLMDRYQVNLQLEKVNQMNLESIHTQFNQVMVNLRSAKGSLLNTMDNIYFNFIQPSRWFY